MLQEIYQIPDLNEEETYISNNMHKVISDINERCRRYAGKRLEFRHIYNIMLRNLEGRLPVLSTSDRAREFEILKKKTDYLSSIDCEEIISNYFEYKRGQWSSPF